MSTVTAEPSVATPVALLSLTVSFDPAINYAFQQNAIPVVKELRFQNDDMARKDLVIRVTTDPIRSAMMDTATLTAHRALLSKAAPVENPAFETLSPEEKGAAIQVQDNKHGIEQEKLPPDFMHGILNSFLN
jgi:hypothetical protein